MGATVISGDSEVIKVRQDTENGGTWDGKRSGGWENRNKKGSRNGESINLLGRHVTEFLTKSCMVAYEW